IESHLQDPEAKVELSIRDEELREGVDEKVRIPVVDPIAVTAAGGVDRAKAGGAELVNEPDPAGRVFARLPAGAAANVTGAASGYVKLALGDGRFGFVRAADVEHGGPGGASPALEDAMSHAPPALEIPQPQLATRDPHTVVHG